MNQRVFVRGLLRSERGVATFEFGLLAGLGSIAALAALQTAGSVMVMLQRLAAFVISAS